ncbi:unnamed protein product [Phytomonas sp. EM1]|nr:unnamed protein product [Phytomonas sp. EM1]|eukprot:CCW63708.1 unnamed protein product [Phytomonas sp. isolate EM1]
MNSSRIADYSVCNHSDFGDDRNSGKVFDVTRCFTHKVPSQASLLHTAPRDEALVDSSVNALDTSPEGSTLLEVVVPMSSKLHPKDETTTAHSLGLCIRLGRGGPHGTLRTILIRLTDPEDPFFLFELELIEEDYSAFKQRLELLVDFYGFPRFFVNMIQGITQGTSPFQISFAVHANDASRGTLRIIEITSFKTVEHISLILIRQGDTGQKTYLAQRFRHFEQAFLQCNSERKEEGERAHQMIQDLKHRVEGLTEANRSLKEELRVLTAQSEKDKLTSLNTLREVHQNDMEVLRNSYEDKLKDAQNKVSNIEQHLKENNQTKDAIIDELRKRSEASETTLKSLRLDNKHLEETRDAQQLELEKLRKLLQELKMYQMEATSVISENKLNYVSLSERLRSSLASLQSKEEELETAKSHLQKQDSYINMLNKQNEQLTTQLQHVGKSLDKANYIIGNQLQTIKNTKERFKVATEQLRTHQALLSEQENASIRVKKELASYQDHVQSLQVKNNELREQLQKTDEHREKLSQELKQTQMALLHLQRSTSVTGRHWSSWGSVKGSLSPGLTSNATSWKPSPSLDALRGPDGRVNSPSISVKETASYAEDSTARMPLFAYSAAQEDKSAISRTPSAGAMRAPSCQQATLGKPESRRVSYEARMKDSVDEGIPTEHKNGVISPSSVVKSHEKSRQRLHEKSFLEAREMVTVENTSVPVSAYF